MTKVLMAAPFEANGRYKGGISSVVNNMMLHQESLDKYSLDIIEFNTCRVERSVGTDAKVGTENIKNSILLYKSIPKEIQSIKPEVLYYHSSIGLALLKDLLIIRHVKKKTKIKTVIHIHFADYKNIMTGNADLDRIILHCLNNFVDEIVFLSKITMREFIAHGINSDKCTVIYNFSTFDLNKNDEDEEYIYKVENPIKLLFVGSIGHRKGFFDLVDVVEKLKNENIELHICGISNDQESENILKEYQKKLDSKIIFHGFVSGNEKDQIYKESDILVLPSYREGLPMVILEAFSAGCAVISTNVGAIPEIVGENNGKIIDPGDKEALKNAISDYVLDISKLQMTQKENLRYAEQFMCDEFIRKVAKVCEKVTGYLRS